MDVFLSTVTLDSFDTNLEHYFGKRANFEIRHASAVNDVILSAITLNWRYSSKIICRLSKIIADIHLDSFDINCGHYLGKKTNFEIGHASAKMDVVLRTFTLDRRISSQTICRSSKVIADVHLDSLDITLGALFRQEIEFCNPARVSRTRRVPALVYVDHQKKSPMLILRNAKTSKIMK